MSMRGPLLLLLCALVGACGPDVAQGPFAQVEEKVWRVVNRNHRGADGLYVQATFRTLAYEIAQAYKAAEAEALSQEQLQSRLQQLIYSFIDASYPAEDGTDINNLYIQYLIYANPGFDPTNKLEVRQFNTWRSQFVRRVVGKIYDIKYPVLRNNYDERWGLTLYSRLVFAIHVDNEQSDLKPHIADIGARTFLVDEHGERYEPSGLAGPYPYEYHRPEMEVLDGEIVYWVFFPNRKADRKTPILTKDSKFFQLVIEGLGEEPERTLQWNLPLVYPKLPQRRLYSEAEAEAAAVE